MKKQINEETKLILLPNSLVERLKEASLKNNISLSEFASEALEQALRANGMGAKFSETVDLFRMMTLQKEAGAMTIPRTNLNFLIEKLHLKDLEELKTLWQEAGRWYGEYLSNKMQKDEVFKFLKNELRYAWNLDEVDVVKDDDVLFRFTSFTMELELTELLLCYIDGIMESLGYREIERDHLRGMASLKFTRFSKT